MWAYVVCCASSVNLLVVDALALSFTIGFWPKLVYGFISGRARTSSKTNNFYLLLAELRPFLGLEWSILSLWTHKQTHLWLEYFQICYEGLYWWWLWRVQKPVNFNNYQRSYGPLARSFIIRIGSALESSFNIRLEPDLIWSFMYVFLQRSSLRFMIQENIFHQDLGYYFSLQYS